MRDPFQSSKRRRRGPRLIEVDAWIDTSVFRAGRAIAAGFEAVSIFMRRFKVTGFKRAVVEVAGDAMTLVGPFGSFYLRAIQRPVLMLAGGTGLAPFLAMLDRIVAAGGSPHPIHLIYGVNTDRDVVETERLEAYARLIPSFTFAVVVVDADSAWPRKGYVTHHIEPAHLNDGDVDIYLCGPPPMVEAVAQHLRDVDVKSASFHYEKFAASVS